MSGLVESRVGFWDVEDWMRLHPVHLCTPYDAVALVLEERGIKRASVRFVYPDPIEASMDYIVLYKPEPVAARGEAGKDKGE